MSEDAAPYRHPREIPYDERPATMVIFRRFSKREGGQLIALFPYELDDYQGRKCISYMHTGQHSAADYGGLVDVTKSVRPDEPDAVALAAELENQVGYRLVPVQRVNAQRLTEARKEHREALASLK